jgi:hypothetical protein
MVVGYGGTGLGLQLLRCALLRSSPNLSSAVTKVKEARVRQRSDGQRFGVGNKMFELQILQLSGTYIHERLLLAHVQ